MKTLLILAAAAALTLLWAPGVRGPFRRLLFYRDLPPTPAGHQPTMWYQQGGIRTEGAWPSPPTSTPSAS